MSYKISNIIGFILGFISLIIVNALLSLICLFIFIKIPQLSYPVFNRFLGDHFTWSSIIVWFVQIVSGFIGGKICYSICKEKYAYQHKPGCIALEILVVIISLTTVVLSIVNGSFTLSGTIVSNVAVLYALFLACNGESLTDIFDT